MQEQVVLRQEPSKQQAVPLLVSALRHEELAYAAKLAQLRAQANPQPYLRLIEMLRPALVENSEIVERGARGAL
jgi:hypothetical protein